MGRTLLGQATTALGLVFLLAGFASADAITFETGTYVLGNHPDGEVRLPTYGARLDNLFEDVAPFTFDFECDACAMTLVYDGSTIDISGTAYGGRHDGAGGRVDDEFDGLYEFDVSYDATPLVENEGEGDDSGLQDIGRVGETAGLIGSLTFLSATSALEAPPPITSWQLDDKAGSHFFSLRVGDEDNDEGHRGYDGISGWGWLMFQPSPDLDVPLGGGHHEPPWWVNPGGAQDWLFTAERTTRVPAPGSAALLLVGLVALRARRRRV